MRVLRLVLKQRRSTGRAGNFFPKEPLGLALRLIWIPLVALWVVLPGLDAAGFDDSTLLRPMLDGSTTWWSRAIPWLGAIVALIAMALTMVCWQRMGKSWRMGIDPGESTQLVVSGPYGYVRHPIYALQILLIWATFAATPSLAMLVVATGLSILLIWEALREEQYLLKAHGTLYGDYRSGTGGFFPKRLRPYRGVTAGG